MPTYYVNNKRQAEIAESKTMSIFKIETFDRSLTRPRYNPCSFRFVLYKSIMKFKIHTRYILYSKQSFIFVTGSMNNNNNIMHLEGSKYTTYT